jgi:histidyl-tRNA synthetase
MPIYEKKWWKKIFYKQKEVKINPLKDLNAIVEFLNDLDSDKNHLLKDLKQLQELEKERSVAKNDIVHVNLDTQSSVYDNLLERYEFFQSDVDINAIRLKRLANKLLIEAHNAGMKDLIKSKKKDAKWQFKW